MVTSVMIQLLPTLLNTRCLPSRQGRSSSVRRGIPPARPSAGPVPIALTNSGSRRVRLERCAVATQKRRGLADRGKGHPSETGQAVEIGVDGGVQARDIRRRSREGTQPGLETRGMPGQLEMGHTKFEQLARERQHVGDRRQLRAQGDALDHAGPGGEPGETKPAERRHIEKAAYGLPEAEGPAAEAEGEGDLDQGSRRGGLCDVTIRREVIRRERRAHEVRAIVEVLPTDERAHTRVDAVPATQQRADRIAPETVAPGAKGARREAEGLLE